MELIMNRILLYIVLTLLLSACSNNTSNDILSSKISNLTTIENSSFTTYFAPYDNTIEQDLILINKVIEARLQDQNLYFYEENPYIIRYAVYNLRNDDIINRLIYAHLNDVKVQILIENKQLDPEKTWNTVDERMIEAGFLFSETHKDLTETEKQTLNLIGIKSDFSEEYDFFPSMHLKSRIYNWLDINRTPKMFVISGSMNPGDAAPYNDETLHVTDNPYIVERYIDKYNAVLNDSLTYNTWNDNSAVNVLFTPAVEGPQPSDVILSWIDQEQELILISQFVLRNIFKRWDSNSLIDKLQNAINRGVKVIAVVSRYNSDSVDNNGVPIEEREDDPFEDELRSKGIIVYEALNKNGDFNAMHHKYAVFGLSRMKIVTDTGNWTAPALGDFNNNAANRESFLFIKSYDLDNNATGRRYLSNFLYLLRHYNDQQWQVINNNENCIDSTEDTIDNDNEPIDNEPISDELINDIQDSELCNESDIEKERIAPFAEDLIQQLISLPNWPTVAISFKTLQYTEYNENIIAFFTLNFQEADFEYDIQVYLSNDSSISPKWNSTDEIKLPFGCRIHYKYAKINESNDEINYFTNDLETIIDSSDFRIKNGDWINNTFIIENADWQRTAILIYCRTNPGQDMFVRGGIDHNYAYHHLNRNCTNKNYNCGIPIRYRNIINSNTANWKKGDYYLDWYGYEKGQTDFSEGSVLEWTTNYWPEHFGAKKTVEEHGYGESSLNNYGQHYWLLDVDMDCSKTVNGWFELKSYISNGDSWEHYISQWLKPYNSNGNHFAQCGSINVFSRNQDNPITIYAF